MKGHKSIAYEKAYRFALRIVKLNKYLADEKRNSIFLNNL